MRTQKEKDSSCCNNEQTACDETFILPTVWYRRGTIPRCRSLYSLSNKCHLINLILLLLRTTLMIRIITVNNIVSNNNKTKKTPLAMS